MIQAFSILHHVEMQVTKKKTNKNKISALGKPFT